MYIIEYTFGNHFLRLRSRVAVKLNFRPFIRRYTYPNENFEYSCPLNIPRGTSCFVFTNDLILSKLDTKTVETERPRKIITSAHSRQSELPRPILLNYTSDVNRRSTLIT